MFFERNILVMRVGLLAAAAMTVAAAYREAACRAHGSKFAI